MDVIVARHAGFCFGVERAVQMALQAIEDTEYPQPLCTLGQLIHNPLVVKSLEEKGIYWVQDVEELQNYSPGTLIIRSHGIAPQVLQVVQENGWTVLDATCPYVRYAQTCAALLHAEEYQVLIFGNDEHPEVQGILGHTQGKGYAVSSKAALEEITLKKKVGFLAQTTKQMATFAQMAHFLLKHTKELRIFNTICTVTGERQEDVRRISNMVDLMLVVGGKNSANTRNLVSVCQESGTKVYHIQCPDEIKPQWFINIDKAGIAAGASTPNWIIKEVEELMCEKSEEKKNENNELEEQQDQLQQEETLESVPNQENSEEQDVSDVETPESVSKNEEETGSEVPVEVKEPKEAETDTEQEQDTAEEPHPMEGEEALKYSQMLKSLRRGQIIKGKVVEVKEDGVFVDVGYKTEGFIPKRELEQGQGEDLSEDLQVGEEIYVSFLGMDDEGIARLSKRKADLEQAWETVRNAQKEDTTITGKATKVVKGGLVVDIGLRGFIPASHVAIEYVENLDQFVGQELEMKVLEVEKKNNNVVLSRKKVLEEQQAQMKEETLRNLQEDDVVHGKVTKIVDFGAFVDIGGIEGLLHISEMSWGRIEHPSKVLKEGEELDVKVLNIDQGGERISLGLKQILPDPWDTFISKYQVGDIVDGTITKTVSFGAFMEIENGIEGLIHISQLARRHVETPDEVVSAGQSVQAKVININEGERKVGLSLKEMEVEQQKQEVEKYETQQDEGNITIMDHMNKDDLDKFGIGDLNDN